MGKRQSAHAAPKDDTDVFQQIQTLVDLGHYTLIPAFYHVRLQSLCRSTSVSTDAKVTAKWKVDKKQNDDMNVKNSSHRANALELKFR